MQYLKDVEQETPVLREGPSAMKFLKEYLRALLFDRPEIEQSDLLSPGSAICEQEQAG